MPKRIFRNRREESRAGKDKRCIDEWGERKEQIRREKKVKK